MKALLKLIVNLLVKTYTFIIKRNPQIIMCSGWSGRRFADNSRYIFLYLNEFKDELNLKKIIWLTNDDSIRKELQKAGYVVYKKQSFQAIFYHLSAGFFFYDQFSDDFYVYLTQGARLINLWHGMPIKKFGVWNGKIWDLKDNYLLTCSKLGDKNIGNAFYVKPSHMIHGMYPRNHYLVHGNFYLTDEEKEYMQLLKEQKNRGRKILFYLPTFRKDKLLFLGESDPKKLKGFFDFLIEEDYFLITKIHFAGYFRNNDGIEFSSVNLINLSPIIDIYPFLREADMLITDYSSVFFDFLYLDRDIICYPYDLNEYVENDQGLLVDYQALPADKVYSLGELQINLKKKKMTSDMYTNARKEWLIKCFENNTICDTIKNAMQ